MTPTVGARPDEVFALVWEPVAVEGDVGVARIEVRYGDPPTRVSRDLWIVTLDHDGRCTAFEEWPFFPAGRGCSAARWKIRSRAPDRADVSVAVDH
jgi:hypothetical protein